MTNATPIRTYNKAALCGLYGVGYGVLKAWLVPAVFEHGYYISKRIFSPKDVEKIFTELGPPIYEKN